MVQIKAELAFQIERHIYWKLRGSDEGLYRHVGAGRKTRVRPIPIKQVIEGKLSSCHFLFDGQAECSTVITSHSTFSERYGNWHRDGTYTDFYWHRCISMATRPLSRRQSYAWDCWANTRENTAWQDASFVQRHWRRIGYRFIMIFLFLCRNINRCLTSNKAETPRQ